jgi:histidinol-phosphate aminotransferase
MPTRRSFIKTAGLGAVAAAASASFTSDLIWAEPSRAPQANGPIMLNSNENAYGPFSSVLAMGNPFQDANRYPDRHSDLLYERLASMNKVAVDQVVTGCGSTEILRMAACAFTGPGRKLVTALPTFEAIAAYSKASGAEVVQVPLTSGFAHDLGAMLKAAGQDAGLVYICNPNNPTGTLTPRADIEDFIRKLPKNTHVLIDEAYHDFVGAASDYASFLEHPMDDNRIIVARTFSKIYGLAGMRCGYGIAAAPVVQNLRKYRTQDSLNIFVMRSALISLDDASGLQLGRQRNTADRDEFMHQAAARRLQVMPSFTNFVMVNANRPVHSVIDHFKAKNILIGRPFPPLDTYARISLGKPDEMKQFWQVWDAMTV